MKASPLFFVGLLASAVAAACTSPARDSTEAPLPMAQPDAAAPAESVADAAVVAMDAPFVPGPHRPWPQLVSPVDVPGRQHVLRPMTLVTLVAANDTLSSQLFAFSDALVKSAWWHATSDAYGVGTPEKSLHVTGPAIDHDLTEQEIAGYTDQAGRGLC